MSPAWPFVACFQTATAKYVYDVNTNGIFKVSPEVWEALSLTNRLRSLSGAHDKLAEGLSKETADAVWQHIGQQQDRGIFLSRRPKRVRFPVNRQDLAAVQESQLRQLTLCITEVCNLRCSYCVHGGAFPDVRQHSNRRMSIRTARKAIDFFLRRSKGNPQVFLSFYGGEPLANIALIEKSAGYARSQRPDVHLNLTTNGTLLRGKAVEVLVRHGVRILVSLDGPAELHDSSRVYVNGRPTHAPILRNLERLYTDHPDYYRSCVGFIVTLQSGADLSRIQAFFRDGSHLFDRSRLVINNVKRPPEAASTGASTGDGEDGILVVTRRFVDDLVAGGEPDAFSAALFSRDLSLIHKRSQTSMTDEAYPNGICYPGVQRLFCSVDGRFQICERVPSGFDIGDVDRGMNVDAALELAEKYAALAETETNCCECPAVRMCPACFTRVSHCDGELRKDRNDCDNIRANLEYMMSVYCAIAEAKPDALRFFNGDF